MLCSLVCVTGAQASATHERLVLAGTTGTGTVETLSSDQAIAINRVARPVAHAVHAFTVSHPFCIWTVPGAREGMA